MKLLRMIPLVFLIAVGCGKAKEKSAGEKLLEEMEAGADAFCKCGKDDKCLEEVTKKGGDLDERWKKEFPDESKIPADLKTRFDAATKKVQACAANEPPPPDPKPTGDATPEQQMLTDMEAVKGKVCACTDQACVDKEIEAGKSLDEKYKDLLADPSKLPADIKTKFDEIVKGVEECATKAAGEAPKPPAEGRTAEVQAAVDAFHALKDEICKCADMACAQAAFEKGEGLEDKLEQALGKDVEQPADLKAELDKIEEDAKACVSKLPG